MFKKSHIGLLNFIQDFQDAACAAVTLQVYLFCKNYSWEFKIILRSTVHIKVHSGCLEHLAPTDGTPGIGDGCQIKLAFKAAGDVNWRLGIQVLDPIFSAEEQVFQEILNYGSSLLAAFIFPFWR